MHAIDETKSRTRRWLCYAIMYAEGGDGLAGTGAEERVVM